MVRYSEKFGNRRVIHVTADGIPYTITASYSMLSSANLMCTGRHSKPAVIYEFK